MSRAGTLLLREWAAFERQVARLMVFESTTGTELARIASLLLELVERSRPPEA